MSDNTFLAVFYMLASGFFLMFFMQAIGPRGVIEILFIIGCFVAYTKTFDLGLNYWNKRSEDNAS